MTSDGKAYWSGRDDHVPEEVRVYGRDTDHWSNMSTGKARAIVRHGLSQSGEVQQGDAVRFVTPDAGAESDD